MKTGCWLFGSLWLALLLAGCSSDYNLQDPDEAPFHDNGEGVVGTLGGTVMVGDPNSPIYGAAVILDEGALEAPESIRISEASNVSVPGDDNAQVVSFEPSGLFFEKPVYIALPYDPDMGSDQGIMHYDPETNSVTEMPVVEMDEETGLILVATNHFSHYFNFALARHAYQAKMMYFKALEDMKNQTVFRTVTIGEQTWMADNLNVKVKEFPGTYFYDNKPVNANMYGRLYTFGEGEHTVCPEGFHVPTIEEWRTLIEYVGEDNAGRYLKSKTIWNGADTYGFGVKPGGYYDVGSNGRGSFTQLRNLGMFWTSEWYAGDTRGEYAVAIKFTSGNQVEFIAHDRSDYLSIRCIEGDSPGGGGGGAIETDEFVDTRDGQMYKTTKIGKDWWMAENLNYDLGPELRRTDDSNGDIYGALYPWDYANALCPDGWHLPTDEEWFELEVYLGMDRSELTNWYARESGEVGKKLKSNEPGYWAAGSATDLFEFRARPAGHAQKLGENSFDLMDDGTAAHFWTATESDNQDGFFLMRGIYSTHDGVERMQSDREKYKSVRCVKDR